MRVQALVWLQDSTCELGRFLGFSLLGRGMNPLTGTPTRHPDLCRQRGGKVKAPLFCRERGTPEKCWPRSQQVAHGFLSRLVSLIPGRLPPRASAWRSRRPGGAQEQPARDDELFARPSSQPLRRAENTTREKKYQIQ